MTKEQAISAVIDELKQTDCYNIKIGWSEQHGDGTFAVEVTYNWRFSAWEKTVHQIYACVYTPNGIIATSAVMRSETKKLANILNGYNKGGD